MTRFPTGPIIGPLVIAGVMLTTEAIPHLVQLGVKDSKLLTRKSRNMLAPRIINLAQKHVLIAADPQEIDSVVMRGRPMTRLNLLEAKCVAEVLNTLKPQTAYIDSPDRSPERYACQIMQRLEVPLRIISEHHADVKYPIVSAASILAKVRRDEIIDELHEIYGDFGSGYPSDPKTIRFIREWILKNRCDLAIVRRTWRTLRKLDDELTHP